VTFDWLPTTPPKIGVCLRGASAPGVQEIFLHIGTDGIEKVSVTGKSPSWIQGTLRGRSEERVIDLSDPIQPEDFARFVNAGSITAIGKALMQTGVGIRTERKTTGFFDPETGFKEAPPFSLRRLLFGDGKQSED
jgi:hypothetical protein